MEGQMAVIWYNASEIRPPRRWNARGHDAERNELSMCSDSTTSSLCSVPDCTKPQWARGYCSTHYARWRKHGTPDLPVHQPVVCHEPNCDRLAIARGLCPVHYDRWRQTMTGVCSVEGCDESVLARGYCSRHYARLKKYGSVRDRPVGGWERPDLRKPEAERKAGRLKWEAAYREKHREKLQAYNRERYGANREKLSAYARKWRHEHGPIVFAIQKRYRLAHPEKVKTRTMAWRHANPEKYREIKQRSHLRHKEENNAKQREYAAAHRDAANERYRKWRETNPEHARESALRCFHRRRAKAKALPYVPISRAFIFERDGGVCGICGKKVRWKDMSLDHIIPVSLGGPHIPQNVRLAHRRCNAARGNRGPGQLRLL